MLKIAQKCVDQNRSLCYETVLPIIEDLLYFLLQSPTNTLKKLLIPAPKSFLRKPDVRLASLIWGVNKIYNLGQKN